MNGDWEDPRRVLARFGLVPKRAFSQNFLVSERIAKRIVEACALTATSRAVELGPGCGTLTHLLARECAQLFAVERDPDMLKILEAECDPEKVELVPGDAKTVDFATFDCASRLVVAGNLPYAITGAILRNLYEQASRVERAVLMVQREVRDRLVAAPDTADYGALTIFTSQMFQLETIVQVPRTAFHPPPKVTSSVVRLTPLPSPRAEASPQFTAIVRAAFQARRKTLRNALLQAFPAAATDVALRTADIDGKRRGETLSIEEFDRLARAMLA